MLYYYENQNYRPQAMRERYVAFWARPEVYGRMSNEDGNLAFAASEVALAIKALTAPGKRSEETSAMVDRVGPIAREFSLPTLFRNRVGPIARECSLPTLFRRGASLTDGYHNLCLRCLQPAATEHGLCAGCKATIPTESTRVTRRARLSKRKRDKK